MSRLARALYGFPPRSIVTSDMMRDRKACLDADPRYSDEAIRSYCGRSETVVVDAHTPAPALSVSEGVQDPSDDSRT